jgi:hypothetical protein
VKLTTTGMGRNLLTKNHTIKPWKRQRYTVMKNRITGQKVYTDEIRKRLKKLRVNIFSFAELAKFVQAERLILVGLSYDTLGTKVKASNWKAGDIREFIHSLKQRLGENLKAYAWVAELQQNGHMHYHLAIYADGFFPFPDKSYTKDGKKYKRLWTHGASNVDWTPKGVYYLCRYVGKEKQKDFMNFPKGARSYAIWFADKDLQTRFRAYMDFLENKAKKSLYKKEGWMAEWKFLGSGYKLEYLEKVFGDR